MENQTLVFLISAVLAALSFAAFAYPLLNRMEKKERYKSIIEKKRKSLYEASREDLNKKGKKDDTLSAKDSVAAVFKVQKLLGAYGEKVRDKMLQAGNRSPTAPMKFIIAQIVLPILFIGFAMMIMSGSDKEIGDGKAMFILLAAIFIGYKLPSVIVKNQILKRTEEHNFTFPDALDMMLICVQGGIGLEQTVARIAEEMSEHSEILAEELGILSAEMAMLSDRKVALRDFARRVGSGAAKSFSTALIQAEQYGTSVSTAMRVMSDELRDQRMANAEQKAAGLPPKLTVPMILFFLPVMFIVIIGPTIIMALKVL